MIEISQDEQRLTRSLIAMRDACIRGRTRKEKARRWEECERAYQGLIYQDQDIPEWMSKSVAPKVWEAVERVIPVMTDSKPKLGVAPRGEDDYLVAKNLEMIGDYAWDQQNMEVLVGKLLRNVLIYGTGFMLTSVDPLTGRLMTANIHPKNVFPDPNATSDDDLEHVWVRSYATLSKVRRMFPDQWEKIRDHGKVTSSSNPDRMDKLPSSIAENERSFVISPTNTTGVNNEAETGRPRFSEYGSTELYEIWEGFFLDQSEVEVEVARSTGELDKLRIPAFTGGRIITMVGDILVYDRDNPFAHRDIPIIRIPCYDLPGEYFGMAFVEPLIDIMMYISGIDNKVTNWMAFACDPERVVDAGANVDTENDYPFPGKVTIVSDGKRYDIQPPAPMPEYVWRMRDAKTREFDNTSGVSDISRGNIGGALSEDMSGKAIQMLQEPTYTRIRLMIRNFEAGITRWGRQTLCNAIQFWDERMFQRILPPDTPALGWEDWDQDDFDNMPDVRMTAGSSLPQNKDAKRSEMILLYDRGFFGQPGHPESVRLALDVIEFPNREKIVQSLKMQYQQPPKQQQQMAMAQAAQGGPGPGGQGPPPGNMDKALGAGPTPEEERQANG